MNDEAAAGPPPGVTASPEAPTFFNDTATTETGQTDEPAATDEAAATAEPAQTAEPAATDDAMRVVEHAMQADGEELRPMPPRPIAVRRRIRSASALVLAALLVAIGVLLTLGGVDALVGGGGAGSRSQPPRTSSPAPTSARPIVLL